MPRPVAQAGGIAYRVDARKGGVSVLLVSSKKEPGNWIFPKGHVEPGDLLGPAGTQEFDWRGKPFRVEYFLIRATSETSETDGRKKVWLPFDDALKKLTYPETKKMLRDARPRMV